MNLFAVVWMPVVTKSEWNPTPLTNAQWLTLFYVFAASFALLLVVGTLEQKFRK